MSQIYINLITDLKIIQNLNISSFYMLQLFVTQTDDFQILFNNTVDFLFDLLFSDAAL